MSQSAVNAVPRSNRISGTRDTSHSPTVAARLRSNKQADEAGQKATNKAAVATNRALERLKTPVDNTQAAEPTPARMTRQRTAVVVPTEESSSKDGEHIPQSAASTEAVSQICLCQPEPKIPRPRNAFILYRQSKSQTLAAENPGLSNPEISKLAGSHWQAEPESVKQEWKDLAEQEKIVHAEKYPEYRFQPRHKNKTSPTTGPGEKARCQKCGGQSIAAGSSPFPTPSSTTTSKVKFALGPSQPSTPGSDAEVERGSHRRVTMLNTSHHSDPRYMPASSPLTRKFPDDAIELSDPKRRRYDVYGSAVPSTRSDLSRSLITNGQTPTSAHPSYPSPRLAEARRGSLSAHPDGPFYPQRGSIGASSDSPPPMMQHGAKLMGPPLTRGSSISGRSALHAYPATPITAQHHGLPYSAGARPRSDSESLRLAPLLSPGAGDHSRSIGAMIMTIPVTGKLGQLRRVAPPIKSPAPDAPPYRVRGSIIAVEGDDRPAAEAMLGQLETYLRRNDEFDVRVLAGPQEPKADCCLKDYLDVVSGWHDQTKRMIDFVTGIDYQKADEQQIEKDAAEKATSPAQSAGSGPMETDLEEGEVVEGDDKTPASQAEEQEQELEKKKEEMTAAVEREARRQSAQSEHCSKIPLLLVSNYILTGSNAWSSTLPINDVYSPADHWAWTATLWRGIVGADLTVYVRNIDKERDEPVSAVSAGPSPMERKVEMKDEVGAILVKRDNGKVDDGAVRRVAFEVGEWVSMQAGKHT